MILEDFVMKSSAGEVNEGQEGCGGASARGVPQVLYDHAF